MKKNLAFILVFIFVGFTACKHYGRTRNVKVKNGEYSLKIQYRGRLKFNEERNAITFISPNGYVKYKKNRVQFVAKNVGNGEIDFTYYDGKNYADYDDDSQAIKTITEDIAKHYTAH